MVQAEITHKKIDQIQAQGKADRAWWDQERASIQSKFMKELDEAPSTAVNKPTTPGADKSDEDAVLVEGGGPAASGSAAGSKGGTKKRKAKK